ncbi:MAG: PTS sugar transporter subunit IIA [Caulobacteraceae bacterium]
MHASSKRQALTIVADIAARYVDATAADVTAKLVARERLGSTGVGHGVAVPHARLKGLERMHGVFVQLDAPVDFEAVDEQPVDLIFALLPRPTIRRTSARPGQGVARPAPGRPARATAPGQERRRRARPAGARSRPEGRLSPDGPPRASFFSRCGSRRCLIHRRLLRLRTLRLGRPMLWRDGANRSAHVAKPV